jgi:hypothetical protein
VTDTSRLPSWLREVLLRPARIRVDRIPPPLATVVVALWVVWVVIAVVLVIPGVIESVGADPFEATAAQPPSDGGSAAGLTPRSDGRFLVVWSVLVGTSAVVGAAAVALLLLRGRTAATVGAALLALGTSAVPAFFLAGAGAFGGVGITALLALAATGTALVAGLRRPSRSRDALVAVAGLAVLLVWLPLALDGFTSAVPLTLVSSYTVLGSSAVAVTGFVTIGGVASAAESANATTGTFARRSVGRVLAGALLGAMVAVLVLRFTVLHDVFGELEAELWSLRTPASWPHAALIAGLIVFFALRSGRQPFEAHGQRAVTGIVSLAAGLSNLVLVATAVLLFVLLFVTGDVTDPTPYVGYINVAGLAVLAVLTLFVFRPRYRRSTGRVGAIVGLVYLVPMIGSLVLELRASAVPPFWASPTQVVVLVVAIAAVLYVLGEVRRRRGGEPVIERAMLVRLAVIPVVAIHAGELLPAVWSDALSRPLVIMLSLLAFLFLSPAPSTDARQTARALVAASALQVAILGTFATTIVLEYNAEVFTVVAVIWLAVPVSAMLVCRAVSSGATPASPAGSASSARSVGSASSALPQETSSASAFSMRR